jgi:hypothetical protein
LQTRSDADAKPALLDRCLLAIRRWLEQAGDTWAATPNADERAIHFSALHNVRAALDWCLARGRHQHRHCARRRGSADLPRDVPLDRRPALVERALLAIAPSSRSGAEEMHIQAALGLPLTFTRGGSEAARVALSRSLAIAEARGDPSSTALAHSLLGVSLHLAGQHRDATADIIEAYRIKLRHPEVRGMGRNASHGEPRRMDGQDGNRGRGLITAGKTGY